MKSKLLILFIAASVALSPAKAQNAKTDSVAVATTLKSLFSICKNVDFGDPKTTELGMFYKAAPYIV